MTLTINNLDCTPALVPGAKITRKLNTPAQCTFSLATPQAPPQTGDRIVIAQNNGAKLFTGYISAEPVMAHEGWGERGPIYRYECAATGDEFILDIQPLPARPDFVNRSAGSAIKALAESIAPGAFDTSGIQPLEVLPQFTASRESHFSTHARHVARRARGVFRAHDSAIRLVPIGSITHSIDEADPQFTPDGLALQPAKPPASEITVLAADEPRHYCKDYFTALASHRSYSLGHKPFSQATYTMVEENFAAPLSPLLWNIADPTNALSVTNGKLLIAGGPGAATDGQLVLSFAEQLELAANATLDHCFALFSGSCSGIIGGLYNGAVAAANCLAGFSITADSSGAATITAIINGAPAGSPVSVAALAPIALTTRFCCQEPYRTTEPFHSSLHQSGAARGGNTIPADIRVVLSVQPADGGASSPTVLYDGVLTSAPAFCTYALINGGMFNASLSHTRIARENAGEVQTTSSGVTKTRVQGSSTGGGECEVLSTTRTLLFYSSTANTAGDLIVARYRSSGRAVAAAIAPPDVGATRRSLTRTIKEPEVRTTADCENAALALLDDSAGAIAGEYAVWNDSLASDIWPGDALALNLPSRQLTGNAIVREVDLSLEDLDAGAPFWPGVGQGGPVEHIHYAIKFANDAAAALGFEFERGGGSKAARPLAPAITVPIAGTTYLSSLTHAEVTNVAAGVINVDCGITTPAGGGIEVRRTDTGWGLADGYNLVGRFTAQTFALAKFTEIVDFYLRQYDGAGNYSRYAAALHLDMP